jgi:hypothetical protein
MILLMVLGAGLFVPLLNVSADGVYHTERLNLVPVAGAALRSGYVINIHANGQIIYAREMYQLNGASANTTYQVVGNLYLGNTSCSGVPDAVVPTASLTTNISGDGTAEHIFTPQDAAGLHGLRVGARWQLWDGATLSYQTECTVVTLD